MKDIELIFSSQKSRKLSNVLVSKNGKRYFQFKNNTGNLNGGVIKSIIDFYNSIAKTKIKLPIILEIGKVAIADKLSYVVLECLVFKMLEEGYSVRVNFFPKTTIDTKGIQMSPLNFLNEYSSEFSSNRCDRENKFIVDFKSINRETIKYRRLISQTSTNYLSKLTSDLILFLRNQYEFRENYRKVEYDKIMVIKLANTIGELVGNAIEHGGNECILDIDITHNFKHSNNLAAKYGAVNIAMVNFSSINFGDKVKDKILKTDLSKNIRYQHIKESYSLHKKRFTNRYTEEHFWSLASLQDKISGRPNNYNNGGKGSTELIKSIQNFTHKDYCYLMTGKEIIYLKKEFLDTDKDGFIGFNNRTFLNDIPVEDILGKSKVYLPGVAFNLNFILEELKDENN